MWPGTPRRAAPALPCWQPACCRSLTKPKEAANSSRCREDLAGAASSTHRLCPATESWDGPGDIHGRLREAKCQQDHDTALALHPYPHLSSGFLPRPRCPLQRDPYVNGLWDITYGTFSSYIWDWEGNKQERFLAGQALVVTAAQGEGPVPVLGLQDTPHTTQQHQLPHGGHWASQLSNPHTSKKQ